jgi:uncharacterized protein with PIN domain
MTPTPTHATPCLRCGQRVRHVTDPGVEGVIENVDHLTGLNVAVALEAGGVVWLDEHFLEVVR